MGNQSRDRIAKLDLLIILAVGTYKHERRAQDFSAPGNHFPVAMDCSFLQSRGDSIRALGDAYSLRRGLLVRAPETWATGKVPLAGSGAMAHKYSVREFAKLSPGWQLIPVELASSSTLKPP
jgi:hypothetical protein